MYVTRLWRIRNVVFIFLFLYYSVGRVRTVCKDRSTFYPGGDGGPTTNKKKLLAAGRQGRKSYCVSIFLSVPTFPCGCVCVCVPTRFGWWRHSTREMNPPENTRFSIADWCWAGRKVENNKIDEVGWTNTIIESSGRLSVKICFWCSPPFLSWANGSEKF